MRQEIDRRHETYSRQESDRRKTGRRLKTVNVRQEIEVVRPET